MSENHNEYVFLYNPSSSDNFRKCDLIGRATTVDYSFDLVNSSGVAIMVAGKYRVEGDLFRMPFDDTSGLFEKIEVALLNPIDIEPIYNAWVFFVKSLSFTEQAGIEHLRELNVKRWIGT